MCVERLQAHTYAVDARVHGAITLAEQRGTQLASEYDAHNQVRVDSSDARCALPESVTERVARAL